MVLGNLDDIDGMAISNQIVPSGILFAICGHTTVTRLRIKLFRNLTEQERLGCIGWFTWVLSTVDTVIHLYIVLQGKNRIISQLQSQLNFQFAGWVYFGVDPT